MTSPYHMARASLSLERALPRNIAVHRAPSVEPPRPTVEGRKFAASWLMTLLPPRLWPQLKTGADGGVRDILFNDTPPR